ncbi:MAG: hypothetical protein HC831_16885 [Chloroflexia bacterium]|nr:hypothetical protein [Chloroflexia bacterium]
MNENLLNALMELIALFARVNKTRFIDNAHALLRTYLDQTAAINSSRLHIRRFYEYFEFYSANHIDTQTDNISLKKQINEIVKKINSEMNEEERLILFLSFLELIKLDKKVETEELQFVEFLASELHISRHDYQNSLMFILCDFTEAGHEINHDFLTITGSENNNYEELEGSWIEQNRPPEKDKKLFIVKKDLEGDFMIMKLQGINFSCRALFWRSNLFTQ